MVLNLKYFRRTNLTKIKSRNTWKSMSLVMRKHRTLRSISLSLNTMNLKHWIMKEINQALRIMIYQWNLMSLGILPIVKITKWWQIDSFQESTEMCSLRKCINMFKIKITMSTLWIPMLNKYYLLSQNRGKL